MQLKNRLSIFFTLALILLLSCQKKALVREILWTTAWSPDGQYIAVGGNQGDLKLFDGETFELIKTYPVEGVILSRLKWHPELPLLAVVTQDAEVVARILNIETETWIALEGLETSSRGVDWNPTGSLLAVSEFEGEVSVFTPEGKAVSRFMADPKSVTDLDWHPDKNIMVTVGSQIGVFNVNGDTINTFKSSDKEVLLLCVEWHDSGAFFVTGDYGNMDAVGIENVRLQFWNPNGKIRKDITNGKFEYRNIRWNPSATKLASASEALRIWSPEGNLLAESAVSEDLLWGVDWSPNGQYIVTASSQGNIVLWDSSANKIRELQY